MALIVHPTLGKVDSDEEDSSLAYSTTSSRSGAKYLGLSNQGATCYMNSLLQTLFMTPEFRRAIYDWKYNKEKDGVEEECIPLQLQRLFGLLQLSKGSAVATRALTKSFGWEGSEVFQQHDVQELMRVLFDALEETFKGTQYENLIERLYAGKLLDYIKCKDVNYHSEREDKYLDLSLVIRPFGSSTVMHSLDECLQYFLKPEILDGDNKYYCEPFDKKVAAIKGLKFQSLPYILTIQLKRFDYDPSTFNRIKLNDQVRFPLVWDLNKYISNSNHSAQDDFEAKLQEEVDRLWNQAKSMEGASESPDIDEDLAPEDIPNLPDLVDVNGQISPDQKVEEEVKYPEDEEVDVEKLRRENGEWVYQLYAVLIHSGSAMGGHYYAYIRDLDTNKWYNFNDSHVSEVSESVIRQAWGGKQRSAYSSHYSTSGTNAYMLMYRKVDPEKNAPLPGDELVPEHMKDDIKAIEEAERERLREQEARALKITLKIFYEGQEHRIFAMKNEKYRDLLERVVKELGIPPKGKKRTPQGANSQDAQGQADDSTQSGGNPQSPEDDPAAVEGDANGTSTNEAAAAAAAAETSDELVSMDCVRLRNFSDYYKVAQEAHDLDKVGDKPLGAIQFYDYKTLCIETRFPDEEWEVYDPNGFALFIIEYDPAINDFKPQRSLRVSKTINIGQLKEEVVKSMNCSANDIQLLKLTNAGYNELKVDVFRDDSKSVRDQCHIYEGTKVYVEPKVELADDKDSPAAQRFTAQANSIRLKIYDLGDASAEYFVDADKRWTVARLREEIAKVMKVEPDAFRLHRQHRNGVELKVLDQSLTQASLFNLASIYVARGRPLQPGQHWCKVWVAIDHVNGCVTIPEPVDEDELKQVAARVVQEKIPEKVSTSSAEIAPWSQKSAESEGASSEEKGDGNSPTSNDDSNNTSNQQDPNGSGGTEGDVADVESGKQAESESEKSTFGRIRVAKVPVPADYTHLMDVVASAQSLVDDVKTTILAELKAKNLVPETHTIQHIRLRDKVANRMTKITRGGNLTLAQNSVVMYDNREFIVQILDHEECLQKSELGDAVVRVVRWDRSKWELSEPREVLLQGPDSFRVVGLQLAKLLEIDPFNMRVLCVSQYQFNDLLLCNLWKASPSSRPWMIPVADTRKFQMLPYRLEDGDVVLVQDATEPLRALTPAEIKSVEEMKSRDDDIYYSSYSSSGTGWKYVATGSTYTRKEQGIKIKTRQDRLREAQDKDSPVESDEAKSDSAATVPDGVAAKSDSADEQLLRTRSKHPTLPKAGSTASATAGADAEHWVEASEMAIHTTKEMEEAGGYELFADIA